jgi:hypothetical protein
MMESNSRLADRVIEKILELSADAQIGRRRAAKDSPEFHNLAGAITAYGNALALLIELQHREEFHAIPGEIDLCKSVSGPIH